MYFDGPTAPDTAADGGGTADGALYSVPRSGGSATLLYSGSTGPVFADPSNLYFVGGDILRLPKSGGTPTILFSGPVQELFLGGAALYWNQWSQDDSSIDFWQMPLGTMAPIMMGSVTPPPQMAGGYATEHTVYATAK